MTSNPYATIVNAPLDQLDDLAVAFVNEYMQGSTRPGAGAAEISHLATVLNARLNLIQVRQNAAIMKKLGII